MAEREPERPAGPDEPGDSPGDEDDFSAGQLADRAMKAAEEAMEKLRAEAGATAMELPDLGVPTGATRRSEPEALSLLGDVSLHVKVELGRTRMYVEDVLRLDADSVIELDKPAGDPVDIYVNDRLVARGEVLVLNDTFCVRISEIIDRGGSDRRRPS